MKKGYTIIELLVVIAIAGVLMSLGAYSWNTVASRSRDNTRKTDLERIKTVLEQYSADQRSYPKVVNIFLAAEYQLNSSCVSNDNDPRLSPKYMQKIPSDPRKKFEGCTPDTTDQKGYYLYISSGDPNDSGNALGYALLATLERDTDRFADTDIPVKSAYNKNVFSYYTKYSEKSDQNYIITGGQLRATN